MRHNSVDMLLSPQRSGCPLRLGGHSTGSYDPLSRDTAPKSHGGVFLLMFPILLVFGLGYYTAHYVALLPWLGLSTTTGLIHSICFHVWVVAALVYFFAASNAHPGGVPSTYDPSKSPSNSASSSGDFSRGSEPLRFCSKCSAYKPIRAHHCRICKRCILKMDHHCPWINNCVGFRNQKFFFLFLLFSVFASAHCLLLVLARTIYSFSEMQAGEEIVPFSVLDILLFFLCLVVISPVLAGILTLLCWQIYFISKNVSTIEYYDSQGVGQAYRIGQYDVGFCANWRQVMGESIWQWCLPIPTTFDGISFPIAPG